MSETIRETDLFAEYDTVIGVDEAGRGCLAGPVYVGAVAVHREHFPRLQQMARLTDSKQLTPRRRDRLLDELMTLPILWRVSVVSHRIIDRINILQATRLGMARAVRRVPVPDDARCVVAVDGNQPIDTDWPQYTVVKGDARFKTIAAASIFAKVLRDRFMVAVDHRWPEYGFAAHKGYPSPVHKAALQAHGPCPIHRLSFHGVSKQPWLPFG